MRPLDLSHKNDRYFKVTVAGRTVSNGCPVDFCLYLSVVVTRSPSLSCILPLLLSSFAKLFLLCPVVCEMIMNLMSLSAALDRLVCLIRLLVQIGQIKQTFPLFFLLFVLLHAVLFNWI